MKRFSSIAKKIANSAFAAGLAVTLVGGAARAGQPTAQQRAQEAMNEGKDYVAAWEAASRATFPVCSPPELVAKVARANDEMNHGKDYVAAWQAASNATVSVYSPGQIAKAKLVKEEMNHGKDYVAALAAADRVQPTRVQVARSGGTQASGREAVCTIK